jgi:hypothetical protein
MLNLILLVAVGGLVLGHGLHLTPIDHRFILFLIILGIYGLIGLWIKSNAAALQDLGAEEYRKQSRDPEVYGTLRFPTRIQSHFRDVAAFYHHKSPP